MPVYIETVVKFNPNLRCQEEVGILCYYCSKGTSNLFAAHNLNLAANANGGKSAPHSLAELPNKGGKEVPTRLRLEGGSIQI